MATQDPQKVRNSLIARRKKELNALGYKPGIIDLAMDWAVGCAEGMARYAGDQENLTAASNKFLPQYLRDCEKYMRSFGHERGEVKPEA
jgi:hypothetical protein